MATSLTFHHQNKIHFINSGKQLPGIFSCGIDTFLELAVSVIKYYLTEIDKSFFCDLIHTVACQYEYVINNFPNGDASAVAVLNDIREPGGHT